MKTDKSTKVGGRRKAAPAASMAPKTSMHRGNPITAPGGRLAYTNGKPATGRPCKYKRK